MFKLIQRRRIAPLARLWWSYMATYGKYKNWVRYDHQSGYSYFMNLSYECRHDLGCYRAFLHLAIECAERAAQEKRQQAELRKMWQDAHFGLGG